MHPDDVGQNVAAQRRRGHLFEAAAVEFFNRNAEFFFEIFQFFSQFLCVLVDIGAVFIRFREDIV